ncbi:MAG TPA: flagellar hook-length control protein FliK [Desulfobulbus sp.]|nr:flagellar hook-length control protein FliK [Desulfobulbus sp.]
MQAMQAIPVAPQPTAPPAEPPATHQTTHGDHFSKHLNDARNHAAQPEHAAKKADDNANDLETRVSGEHTPSGEKTAQTDKAQKSASDQAAHTVHSENGKKEDEQADGSEKDLLQQVLGNSPFVQQPGENGPGIINEQAISAETEIPIIVKVENSISIQNTEPTPPVQDKESIVAAVLGKVTGEQTTAGAQISDTPAQQVQTGTQQESIIVERWQAQFTYSATTTAVQGKNGKFSQTNFSQTKQETIGMTISAQAVQAQVTPVGDQTTRGHGTPGTGLEAPGTPQDANSNFIHSNLPGVKTVTDADTASGNNPQSGQSEQGPAKNTILTPEMQTSVSQAGSDVPLVFSLDQATTQTGQVSGLDNPGSLSLHLPSGIEIPHSQIIDQVTGHFALNRSLESGTITMRLHPAELGELRMEIKVEQDNIKAHITAQNPQVQDILDRNLPRLREALQQQGMNLAHMQVSVATDGGGNSQLFQEQFNQNYFEKSGRSKTARVAFSLPEEEQESSLTVDPDQNLSVHI